MQGLYHARGCIMQGLYHAGVMPCRGYIMQGLCHAGVMPCRGYIMQGLYHAGVISCRGYIMAVRLLLFWFAFFCDHAFQFFKLFNRAVTGVLKAKQPNVENW